MKTDKILLGHGSGGTLTSELIEDLFMAAFSNDQLRQQTDSALLNASETISFTTDSFVVDPIIFPGGNIGKIAIAGTVNDLAVSGATPKYLSCGFIIEEGFPFDALKEIVNTMAAEAQKAGVSIVTGDTKVVDKGKCDKVFINTSGIGFLPSKYKHISTAERVKAGDLILINGSVGDHGMTIMAKRNDLNLSASIASDCASLNHMIQKMLDAGIDIHFMRDATRGGLATVINELASTRNVGIQLREEDIPVKNTVRGICELLGFDPMFVANEGKVVMIIDAQDAEKAMDILQSDEYGKDAAIIGQVVNDHPGKAWLETSIGGKRIIDRLTGEQLPRIC